MFLKPQVQLNILVVYIFVITKVSHLNVSLKKKFYYQPSPIRIEMIQSPMLITHGDRDQKQETYVLSTCRHTLTEYPTWIIQKYEEGITNLKSELIYCNIVFHFFPNLLRPLSY